MFALGIISLVIAAASTAYGVASSIQTARAQAEMQEAQAKAQAASLRQQADQEEQDQLQRSMLERRQNARRLAAAETQYAASGVTLQGTPTLALETMTEEQELETSMMESASGQKRQLLLTDAYNAEKFGIAGANLTSKSGVISGIGSGLGGSADLGWKGYSLNKDGAFNNK